VGGKTIEVDAGGGAVSGGGGGGGDSLPVAATAAAVVVAGEVGVVFGIVFDGSLADATGAEAGPSRVVSLQSSMMGSEEVVGVCMASF
jgi:hypothetical protein